MQTIQSGLVPLELSVDNGVTWQLLVCLTQYNIPLERSVNTVETFCGNAVGLGTTSFNPTGTAIIEAAPTAGSQLTFEQLTELFTAGTLIKFRARYPTGGSTGNNVFLAGDCYITSLNFTAQIGNALQFDFTLTGQGDLDTTP